MKNKINLFIVGMPRSGTKLLRELLNSSEYIYIPEAETQFFPYLYEKYGNQVDFSNEEIKKSFIKDIEDSMFTYYLKKEFKYVVDFSFLKKKRQKEELSLTLSKLLFILNKKPNLKYLGEKTPEYLFHTDLLKEKFPEAKFIHIIRDPRDHVLSMKKAWGKNIFLAAYKWNKEILKFQDSKKKLHDDLLEIKYEELLSRPKHVLSQICEFLEIEFDEKMLTPNSQVENKGDAKGQKSIKKDNFNKFLKKLNKIDVFSLEKILFDSLKLYDYHIINKNKINQSKAPSYLRLKWYRMLDVFNVAKDALKIHGFKNGLKKIILSQKQFASKN